MRQPTLASALDLLIERAGVLGGWARLAMLKKHRAFIIRRIEPSTPVEAIGEDVVRDFIVEQLVTSGPRATSRRVSTLRKALDLVREEGLVSGPRVDISTIARRLLPRKRALRAALASSGKAVTVTEAARTLRVSRATLLRLEGNGTLVAQRTPGGHRRYAAAAVEALASRQGTRPTTETVDPLVGAADPGTLKEALQYLLARFGTMVADVERSAATLGMHERHARYLLQRLGSSTRLAEIDEDTLDRFVTTERQGRRLTAEGQFRTLKPGTVKKRLFTLRLALKLAKRRKLISHLPEWPHFTVNYKPRKRFLRSFAEYRRLFEALPLQRAEWMSLCLWTAQHAGDVERMTWEDCDPFASPPWMFVRNTKNRRDGIRVKMPSPLGDVLRAKWLREGPERTSPIVGIWSNRGHELPRTCRRLGLPELASIDLRHTGLSWMIRKKGITKAAMEFAGHSSPAMMAKIYGHALPLQLLEVVEDLESIEHEPEAAIDLGRALPTAGPGPALSYPVVAGQPPSQSELSPLSPRLDSSHRKASQRRGG